MYSEELEEYIEGSSDEEEILAYIESMRKGE